MASAVGLGERGAARALAAGADGELQDARPLVALVAVQVAGQDRGHVAAAEQRHDRVVASTGRCTRTNRTGQVAAQRPERRGGVAARRGVGLQAEHDDLDGAVLGGVVVAREVEGRDHRRAVAPGQVVLAERGDGRRLAE